MSPTSSDRPLGATGYGAGPSMSNGSPTPAGSTQSASGPTGSASSAQSSTSSAAPSAGTSDTMSSGADYYGSGSPYSSGSTTAFSGSSGSSGASGASGAARSGGASDTSLSRGAVTTRTGPQPRVGGAGASGTPGAGPATAATAAVRPTGAARKTKGPRRVRLAVARVDPWSVMKMSFLLSVALGIAGVVLTAVLWMILSTMNVFTDIEGVLQSLQTTTSDPFSIKDYVGFGRIVSLSIVIGVIDVILMTAIATVMAFLYNICSALVGGVQLTLTDD